MTATKKKTQKKRRKPRAASPWFNAYMRLAHRELARLEEENERLRKLTR